MPATVPLLFFCEYSVQKDIKEWLNNKSNTGDCFVPQIHVVPSLVVVHKVAELCSVALGQEV